MLEEFVHIGGGPASRTTGHCKDGRIANDNIGDQATGITRAGKRALDAPETVVRGGTFQDAASAMAHWTSSQRSIVRFQGRGLLECVSKDV